MIGGGSVGALMKIYTEIEMHQQDIRLGFIGYNQVHKVGDKA